MNGLSKAVVVSLVALCGAVLSDAAVAQYLGLGLGYHGHGRLGISLGLPLYGPAYYPGPYVYPAPAYAYPAPAYAYPGPVYSYPAPAYAPGPTYAPSAAYVEQSYAAPAPVQPEWYYCASSNAYFPYVRECPGGWQRVPAQPPSR